MDPERSDSGDSQASSGDSQMIDPEAMDPERSDSCDSQASHGCCVPYDVFVLFSACASILLWISSFLYLYSTMSSYWIWMQGYSDGRFTTFGSGAFYISHISHSYLDSPRVNVAVQFNRWSSVLNETMCVGDMFQKVGRYGFCEDGENGAVREPSSIIALQSLLVAVSIKLDIKRCFSR